MKGKRRQRKQAEGCVRETRAAETYAADETEAADATRRVARDRGRG